SSPTLSSAFWPGAANSRSGTRPSLFRPTSITAMSFSMPVTVPFTTLPSKVSFSPPRLLLRSSAKSSRVGNVVVAIRSIVSLIHSGLPLGRHHGGPSHADLVKCTAEPAHPDTAPPEIRCVAEPQPCEKARPAGELLAHH